MSATALATPAPTAAGAASGLGSGAQAAERGHHELPGVSGGPPPAGGAERKESSPWRRCARAEGAPGRWRMGGPRPALSTGLRPGRAGKLDAPPACEQPDSPRAPCLPSVLPWRLSPRLSLRSCPRATGAGPEKARVEGAPWEARPGRSGKPVPQHPRGAAGEDETAASVVSASEVRQENWGGCGGGGGAQLGYPDRVASAIPTPTSLSHPQALVAWDTVIRAARSQGSRTV